MLLDIKKDLNYIFSKYGFSHHVELVDDLEHLMSKKMERLPGGLYGKRVGSALSTL
jgi:hypothetical protein